MLTPISPVLKVRHFFVTICFSVLLASAAQITFANEEANHLNSEMKAIHGVMQELFPMAVKSRELSSKERKKVEEHILFLKQHITHLEPSSSKRSEPFKISLDMLTEHLNQTQSAIENKEFTYARSLIRELPQLCSTCHTQDEQVQHFDSSHIKEVLGSDFERGEYHFMTRDYQEALLDFNDHLAKQKRIKHGHGNSEAMEKILLIYLNIFKDPQNATAYFNRLLESEKLNLDFAVDINHWLNGLERVKTGPYKIERIEDIEKEISKILSFENGQDIPMFISEENKVSGLWLRGLIYDFIKQNPSHKDTAKLLYWLASLESSLEFGIYYQLPEIYLKSCVENYPKHPYAKKCLEQYKTHVTLQYTGSSGTHIPVYKEVELESLSNKLEKARAK